MTRSRILIAILIAAAVGATVWAFIPGAIPVEVAKVTRGPFVATIDEDGKTRVRERFFASAPLPGRATRLQL